MKILHLTLCAAQICPKTGQCCGKQLRIKSLFSGICLFPRNTDKDECGDAGSRSICRHHEAFAPHAQHLKLFKQTMSLVRLDALIKG